MNPTLHQLRRVDDDTAEVVMHFAEGPQTYRLTVLREDIPVIQGTDALYADLYTWPEVYQAVYRQLSELLTRSDTASGAA